MNLILQHYNGTPDELAKLSINNIAAYAQNIGADYDFITGKAFRSYLSDQSQKLFFLDERFDDYDTVVMLDCDMFARTDKSIFDVKGMGRHTQIQSELVVKIGERRPDLANKSAPYWGGAVYKFDRETRIQLRDAIPDKDTLGQLDRMLKDESIMHYLAWKSNLQVTDETYFNGECGGEEWDMNSFDKPEAAHIVHIRPKWTLQGPKTTKMIIYKDLVDKCVI